MNTETLDKLYLEWSQFSHAKTEREIALENLIQDIDNFKSHESTSCMAHLANSCVKGLKPEEWIYQILDKGFIIHYLNKFGIKI